MQSGSDSLAFCLLFVSVPLYATQGLCFQLPRKDLLHCCWSVLNKPYGLDVGSLARGSHGAGYLECLIWQEKFKLGVSVIKSLSSIEFSLRVTIVLMKRITVLFTGMNGQVGYKYSILYELMILIESTQTYMLILALPIASCYGDPLGCL